MSRPFAEQVSAVSPLTGDAIDGAPRPKPGRERRVPNSQPAVERERHCIRCGYRTADVEEFADHAARELWAARVEVVGADAEGVDPSLLMRRTPNLEHMPAVLAEALKAWRASLSIEELRAGTAEFERRRRAGEPLSDHLRQMHAELHRRYGRPDRGRPRLVERLTYEQRGERARWRNLERNADLTGLDIEELRAARNEARRLESRGEPVPDEVRRRANEYQRRRRYGEVEPLSAEERRTRQFGDPQKRRAMMPPLADLVARRQALGLSLRELGERLGVSDSAIALWEKGRNLPPEAKLGPYLEALGLTGSARDGYELPN